MEAPALSNLPRKIECIYFTQEREFLWNVHNLKFSFRHKNLPTKYAIDRIEIVTIFFL